MNEFDIWVKKVEAYHGHICAGIALGTRISLAAMHTLGFTPGEKNKNLIVYTEIDRCMTDAVIVITGCSLGKRSLKHVDYGKFAASFIDTGTGRAIRATIKAHFGNEIPIEETLERLAAVPDNKLVSMEDVTIKIAEMDLPGLPLRKVECSICGEKIMDGRDVIKDGKILCRACANGAYYRVNNVKTAERKS